MNIGAFLRNNHIIDPHTVYISPEVDPDCVQGVTIHPGCRIMGANTIILQGSELGREGPVTIKDCQLSKGVVFNGGYARNSTFLDGVEIGSGAHIREACLLEEHVKVAHTVGLKQTILFPYVTLGSLINFCDCLMAGGTDPKNHSEVGSSYIHFNFTPNQDKATASIMGDVPRGVMLREPPIFLGGQGGIVGPIRVEYGVVIAAGVVLRKDVLRRNVIVLGERSLDKTIPFQQGYYPNIRRILELNINYIANLIALYHWYKEVRQLFFNGPMDKKLMAGAMINISSGINERIKRVKEVINNLPKSIEIESRIRGTAGTQKYQVINIWPDVESILKDYETFKGDETYLSNFKKLALESNSPDYISFIKGLKTSECEMGSAWLSSIVSEVSKLTLKEKLGMA